MHSYIDLLKSCEILKNEIESIYNEYGIELRLLCYKKVVLSILEKEKEYIANELKEKVMNVLNTIYYYPEPYKDDTKLINLFGYEFKKIKDLANYFKGLSPIICGEYKFFFKAFELFESSVNEICFDIIDRAFLEAKSLNMHYSDFKNPNLEINSNSKLSLGFNTELFELYDFEGNRLDEKNVFSKVKKKEKNM